MSLIDEDDLLQVLLLLSLPFRVQRMGRRHSKYGPINGVGKGERCHLTFRVVGVSGRK